MTDKVKKRLLDAYRACDAIQEFVGDVGFPNTRAISCFAPPSSVNLRSLEKLWVKLQMRMRNSRSKFRRLLASWLSETE